MKASLAASLSRVTTVQSSFVRLRSHRWCASREIGQSRRARGLRIVGELLLSPGITVTYLEGVRPLPGRDLAVARIPAVLPSFPVTNDSKHDSPATRIPASRNAFQFLRHLGNVHQLSRTADTTEHESLLMDGLFSAS